MAHKSGVERILEREHEKDGLRRNAIDFSLSVWPFFALEDQKVRKRGKNDKQVPSPRLEKVKVWEERKRGKKKGRYKWEQKRG